MKAVKIFLTVIAWLGLLMIAVGAFISFWVSITKITLALETHPFIREGIPIEMAYAYTLMFSCTGILLTLGGGIVIRPRYLGTGFIIIGAIYIISFVGIFIVDTDPIGEFRRIYVLRLHYPTGDPSLLLILLLPGLIAIMEGIGINGFRKKIHY